MARANGQTALAYYIQSADPERYTAAAIDVISFEGERIKDITAFVMPEMFERFGLPAEIEL